VQEASFIEVTGLLTLCGRPERHIAVVSHAGFIRHTLSAFASELPEDAQEELTREFRNCEMRSVVVSDTGIAAPKDEAYFPGGQLWQIGSTLSAHTV
jgi:broad specificity phosphatase PhoE